MSDKLVSPSRRYELDLQDDGNVVVYRGDGSVVWASGADPAPIPDPPAPPDPPTPTTNLALVMANFCNLTDSVPRPIFSSCLAAQSPEMQEEWITRERLAGGTHYVLSIETGYPGYGDPLNFYTAGLMPTWLEALDRVLAAGLVPVVFLSSGNRYPGADYFRGVIAAIPASYHPRCVWVCGWECVAGGWSSAEFLRGNLALREALGSGPLMGCHLSQGRLSFSSHPIEPDDPWQGDEVRCWRDNWGPQGHPFDVFLYQSIVADSPFDPTSGWGGRAKECIDRLVGGRPPAPDWFAGIKRPIPVWFEATAFSYIRGQSTSDDARRVARDAQTLGFVGFGNGLP
jgi:hypothetical protein